MLPAQVQQALDAGTAAFRAGDLMAARGYYRTAAELAPDVAAAWFGVYLAENRLGNQAAADSAAARVNELSPELMRGMGMMGEGHPGTPEPGGG